MYYQGLSPCVKQMVTRKGFDGIIFALTYGSYASSQAIMCALVEQCMDITHSFHLPFREITVTPLDFATITGLSFSGEPVSVSNEAYNFVVVRNKWLKDLFRATAIVKFGCTSLVRDTELMEKVRSGNDASRVTSK